MSSAAEASNVSDTSRVMLSVYVSAVLRRDGVVTGDIIVVVLVGEV